ncbi:MAG: hypothetical protein ABI182_04270, partial [Candidatus Baltobacteraceae bacterium]
GIIVVANLLGISKSTVSRWKDGSKPISGLMSARISDMHYVLNRLFQTLNPAMASAWLTCAEPQFGGARPIDVLAKRGAAPLIRALEGIAAGTYM